MSIYGPVLYTFLPALLGVPCCTFCIGGGLSFLLLDAWKRATPSLQWDRQETRQKTKEDSCVHFYVVWRRDGTLACLYRQENAATGDVEKAATTASGNGGSLLACPAHFD